MRGRRLATALFAATLLAALVAARAGAIGFLYEWGGSGSAPGEFGFPVSVATNALGQVYVADSENNRVEVFDEAGGFVSEWGSTGTGPGAFNTPESVAVDPGGRVYVVDKGNFRVEKFSAEGAYLGQWGSQGSGPGQLQAPEGIAADATGVYVADAANNRIVKYDYNGALVAEWGSTGSGPGQFREPSSVAADGAGNVYVADSENDRVQKFTSGGAFVSQFDGSGPGHGKFEFAVAVGTDASGRVLVADSGSDEVMRYSPKGKLQASWGNHGSGPGQFSAPIAVAAGASGRVFVADAGNDRIEAFGKLADPVYGKTVIAGPVSGVIRVRLPGSKKFIVLATEMELPVGTVIDARGGRVRLVSVKHGGTLQSADFFDGEFRVLQPKGGKPITVLKLITPLHCGGGKGKHGSAAARKHGSGLWGSGHGNYRSEGRHGSATVQGTIWWSQDNCAGTLFRVKRGIVTIRDFTRHKTVKIHAGEHYLAPAG